MNREVNVAVYFLIYLAIPAMILHYVELEYPGIVESSVVLITMLFLLILFVASSIALYVRYETIPTMIGVIATVIYSKYVFANVHMTIMGAVISVNFKNILTIIYALLAVKIILAIYSDMKQKHLSLKNDTVA